VRKGMVFFGVGLLITVVIAAVVSQFASTQPDSLMYVAEQGGFVNTAEAHALDQSPLAGYGGDSESRRVVAGVAGVLATLGLGYLVFFLAKAGKTRAEG